MKDLKKFEEPELKINRFSVEDVITQSVPGSVPGEDEDDLGWT